MEAWHLGKWEQYSQGRQVKLSQGQFAYTKKETSIFHSQISAVQDLRCSVNCWSSCKMLTTLKLFIYLFTLLPAFFQLHLIV